MAFHRLERIRNCPAQTLDGIPLTTFTSAPRARPGNLEALDYHVEQFNKLELKFKCWSFDGTRILKWPDVQLPDQERVSGQSCVTLAPPKSQDRRTLPPEFVVRQRTRIESHRRKKELLNRIMDTTNVLSFLDRGKTMTTFVQEFRLMPIYDKYDECKSLFPRTTDEVRLRCILERELNSYFGTHEINDKRRKQADQQCMAAKKKLWLLGREEKVDKTKPIKTKKKSKSGESKYWITDQQLDEMLMGTRSRNSKTRSKSKDLVTEDAKDATAAPVS